jgi:hypothetical protein
MTRARDLAAFVSNADGDIKFDTDTLFIDSSANRVGIGTDTPATQIELSSTDPTLRFNDSNGGTDTKNFELRYVGTSSPDIDGLYFRTVNDANSVYTNKVAMLGSGNVGIGTDSPSQKLHVEGAGNQFIYLNNSTTSDSFYIKAGTGASSIQTGGGSHIMNFFTNGTERMRILSGGGLTFNGDTAAANALDDYEEGSWTPSFDSGYSSITYAVQVGSYTKIGDTVRAYFRIDMSSATPLSSAVRINGLPYAAVNNGHVYHTGTHYTNAASAGGEHSKLLVFPNDVRIYLYSQDETAVSQIVGTTAGATLDILGQVIYQAT